MLIILSGFLVTVSCAQMRSGGPSDYLSFDFEEYNE
jgi:hypothetical protein